MRNKLTEVSITEIGTVVFYKKRSFVPEITGVKDWTIENAGSSEYLFSCGFNSEYIDFSKYDFRFNLPETKYWSTLPPNHFNYLDTKTKIGEDFDYYSEYLVPQLSNYVTDKEEKHFFGQIQGSQSMIYFLRVPSEVWKLEFYNNRVYKNNDFSDYPFIDTDLLDENNPPIISPVLSVYFGPSPETQIESYELVDALEIPEFANRYYDSKKSSYCLNPNNQADNYRYLDFPLMSKKDYILSYKEEVLSEKMFYLVNTSNGAVDTIDLFSEVFPLSNNKYRNMNKNILRNDGMIYGETSIFSKEGEMVFDVRSDTLLGVKVEDFSGCPLFIERYNRIPDYQYSRSSGCNYVNVSGRTYVHSGEVGIVGENPEISPFWIPEESLNRTVFNRMYVTKEGRGRVTPSGIIYLREDKDLELLLFPDPGYSFLECTGLPYKKEDNKLTITPVPNARVKVIFGENTYYIYIYLYCEKDSVNYGESTITEHSEFISKRIDLWYYDYELEEMILYNGEDLFVKDTQPFKFLVEFDRSYYNLDGSFYYGDDPETPLDVEDNNSILYITNTKDELLNNNYITIAGNMVCKKLMVNVDTVSEIQMGQKKRAEFDFGDQVIFEFAYEKNDGKILTPECIKVINEDLGVEETSGVWTITKDPNTGIVTFLIPKREKNPDGSDNGLGIRNNYRLSVSLYETE